MTLQIIILRDAYFFRPHKLNSQFIVTIFHFFDEGGRSIFNIQYRYLGKWGRGLVSSSRATTTKELTGDAKSSNTGYAISIFTIWQVEVRKSSVARSQDIA